MIRLRATERQARLRPLIEGGGSASDIGRALRCNPLTIRRDAVVVGLATQLADNGRRRKARSRWIPVGALGADALRRAIRPADPTVSQLVAAIRARPEHVGCLRAPSAVATLHARGLSLDDIETCLGIPPAEAMRAIRAVARHAAMGA